MSQMLKSSGAMAGATLASRMFGLVREIVYARFMGVGWVTDAFMFAFTIPNLFRRLLGEGALTAAFIPIFKEKEKIHGEVAMWRAANAVISGLVVAAAVIIALVLAGISIALAAHPFAAKTELMLRLLRVMFPYMLLVCLAAAFMGMLNARGHFFIPAMGATTLNVVMIASVLWLAPRLGLQFPREERLPHQIFALAVGVLAAGVAQAAFQLPSLWGEGFRYRWVSPWGDETVRRVVTKMVPGAIGVAAFQINVLLVQFLAFWVGTGILSSFTYAVRLMEFPQGMFGISLATYLLPTLSGLAAEKKYPAFRATLRHGLGTLIFLNWIAAVLLVVLAVPIVRLLFEHGKFTALATEQAAFALMCLAPGLVAYSSVNIMARAFYALGDVQTPMKVSVVCLVLNFLLAALLIVPLQQGGLGLANTATSAGNVALLLFALRKKLARLEMEPLRRTLLPLALAGVSAGWVAWLGWRYWDRHLGHGTLALKIGAVFAPAILAGAVYGTLALAFKVPAAREMADLFLARTRRSG
ncbi:MAG: murein biosynthesis integral membrane protein MurJ [Verrucomicrobiota bacterium]|nr:murein biosynthesis integral membrane protein MurJ [Verrucomicrobiota bacterium]